MRRAVRSPSSGKLDASWPRVALREIQLTDRSEVFRGSIRANLSFNRGDWNATDAALADAERAAPADLGGRVSRQWRNAKRELLSIRLRRGIALAMKGKQADAVAELGQAKKSDEESIRSAAVLLLASNHLSAGRRAEAFEIFDALSGHDVRFAAPITALKTAVAAGTLNPDALEPLRKALLAMDATAAPVTSAVCDILVRSTNPAPAPVPVPTYASSK